MEAGASGLQQTSDFIRSFIAIELPPEVKEVLSSIQRQLISSLGGKDVARWVAPQGIHLTLKFLGNVKTVSIPDIEQGIVKAVGKEAFLQLHLSKLGLFPNSRNPRVIWVGVGGDVDRISRLQERIEAAMEHLGFDREARPFSAHLTLARLTERTSPGDRKRLGEVAGTDVAAESTWEAREVSLMKSQLTPGGAIYSCLFAASLSPLDKSKL